MVDGRRYAAGFSCAFSAACLRVLSAAVCAGDESGDRSVARGLRGFAAYAAWARGLICWIKNAPLPGISLPSPFLSLGQVEALRRGEYPHEAELNLAELPAVFAAEKTLLQGLDEICMQAIKLVRNGARILLLSDRSASAEMLPIPMAMATGAVHQALVDAGLRTLAGLAVEAGDCRDIHHAAVLIGYGAGAVCPWLALETGRSLAPDGYGCG